jgi:hypothetical protein
VASTKLLLVCKAQTLPLRLVSERLRVRSTAQCEVTLLLRTAHGRLQLAKLNTTECRRYLRVR